MNAPPPAAGSPRRRPPAPRPAAAWGLLGARLLAGAAAVLLVVALFGTWSTPTFDQLGALSAAANTPFRTLAVGRDAWSTYAGWAILLLLVAGAIGLAALTARPRPLAAAALAALAALVFVLVQVASPPAAAAPAAVTQAMPTRVAALLLAKGATGGGETLAEVALVLAAVALIATLVLRARIDAGGRGPRRRPAGAR